MKKPFWLLAVGHTRWATALVFATIITAVCAACQSEPELPAYWTAPAFTLVDETGQPFSQTDIGGRVALVDFIYTNCADTCPLLTATMRSIQERLITEKLFPANVMLLSLTVDPERDSPTVLKEYSANVGANPEGWKFLTGDRSALEETLVQGFKLPFRGPTPAGPLRPGFEITHTNRVIVIDRANVVRGILDGDGLDVEQTVRTLKRLAS
jgi:cytochrome oxidase Cu insertion factor (SCO1/SenC/PrrC family)